MWGSGCASPAEWLRARTQEPSPAGDLGDLGTHRGGSGLWPASRHCREGPLLLQVGVTGRRLELGFCGQLPPSPPPPRAPGPQWLPQGLRQAPPEADSFSCSSAGLATVLSPGPSSLALAAGLWSVPLCLCPLRSRVSLWLSSSAHSAYVSPGVEWGASSKSPLPRSLLGRALCCTPHFLWPLPGPHPATMYPWALACLSAEPLDPESPAPGVGRAGLWAGASGWGFKSPQPGTVGLRQSRGHRMWRQCSETRKPSHRRLLPPHR